VADPDISFGRPRGAEVERRRRKDRGAKGAEGVGCGKGVSSSPLGVGSLLTNGVLWSDV